MAEMAILLFITNLEDPEEDDLEEDPEADPQEDPGEDPDEESFDRMPPTLRAPKRPRFEVEQLAQELRDVNARHAELCSVVNRMETDITQLTTHVQEEEHRAEIAEGRLIELEAQVASDFEEEEELVPAQDADADSDVDSMIEDA
ncbi:hypothetical protein E3N88_07062 [Mikania micrantha]|uniref:Uncharacterized protein n=1 Tax=Mikania micrantha TaxID=192012 RepID=A0A5N6PRU4_9ASTR|nr:hypothetical protein E3N88_07062 [Mikania micrantha]